MLLHFLSDDALSVTLIPVGELTALPAPVERERDETVNGRRGKLWHVLGSWLDVGLGTFCTAERCHIDKTIACGVFFLGGGAHP